MMLSLLSSSFSSDQKLKCMPKWSSIVFHAQETRAVKKSLADAGSVEKNKN